jgi:hypothetical protein
MRTAHNAHNITHIAALAQHQNPSPVNPMVQGVTRTKPTISDRDKRIETALSAHSLGFCHRINANRLATNRSNHRSKRTTTLGRGRINQYSHNNSL